MCREYIWSNAASGPPARPGPPACLGARVRAVAVALVLAAAAGLSVTTSIAAAYWPGAGQGSGLATLATLSAPTISSATAGAETVELSWSSVTAPGESPVEYYVTRDGGAPAGSCPSVNAPSTVTTCTDTGVPIGAHKYVVRAVWRSWSAASAEQSATVSFGAATHFVLEATNASPAAGEADNLTITAKDASNNTVRTYTGTHALLFEGASESSSGSKPIVIDKSGTSRPFGEATEITFTEGKATVGSSKNGVMKLYEAETAHVVVKEGSLSNGTGLAVTVKAAATTKLALSAPTEATAGSAFNVTLTATDAYGNTATSYSGTKTLAWSGPANSPGGHAPEYPSTATSVTFASGVGTASEITLYDAVPAVTLTAKEGSSLKGTASVAVVAAAVKTLVFATIAEQTAGTAFTVTLTATDQYGNTATSYSGAKTLAWSSPASSPSGHAPEYPSTATSVTFTNGSGKASGLKLFDAAATTLTVKEGPTPEGTSGSFNVKAGTYKRIAWTGTRTEPVGKITSATCLFECSAEGLGSEGKFFFKVAFTDEWGNLQSSHGSGSRTVKLSDTCSSCSLGSSTLSIAEGVASSAEATFTGAAGTSWQGTLEASESTLKATATASLKH
jgi:hypothetical protein